MLLMRSGGTQVDDVASLRAAADKANQDAQQAYAVYTQNINRRDSIAQQLDKIEEVFPSVVHVSGGSAGPMGMGKLDSFHDEPPNFGMHASAGIPTSGPPAGGRGPSSTGSGAPRASNVSNASNGDSRRGGLRLPPGVAVPWRRYASRGWWSSWRRWSRWWVASWRGLGLLVEAGPLA
jgi:hypothetical protein